MWIRNKKEQSTIEEVKHDRPECVSPCHTFIEYWSEDKKKCIDCGYEEKLIIKE
jgi:hypothetical protein